MIEFNPEENYALVRGETSDNTRYIQNGIKFQPNGKPVAGQTLPQEATEEVKEPLKPTVEPIDASGLNEKSAKEIQQMVVKLGGEYVNKRAGIEFIIQKSLSAHDFS